MAAFGALIGGAGQEAARVGQQMRQLQFGQWGVIQDNLAKMIADAHSMATTPEQQQDLLNLRADVLKLRPGQDPTKVFKHAQEILTMHPITQSVLQGPTLVPGAGPAGLGETPGTGTMANPQVGPSGMPEQSLASLIGAQAPRTAAQPTAATPATSLVQPGSQPSPAPPGPSPIGANIDVGQGIVPLPAPTAEANIAPLAGAAAAPAGPVPGDFGTDVMRRYQNIIQSGQYLPPALEKAAQPFLANVAELQRAAGLANFDVGMKTNLVNRFLNTPAGQATPAWMKGEMTMWAGSPPGTQAPSWGPVLAAMKLHQKVENTNNMSPQQRIDQHVPEEFKGNAIFNYDNFGGTPEFVAPAPAQWFLANDLMGNQFVADKNAGPQVTIPPGLAGAGQPAPSPAQAAPKFEPTATGGVEQTSAAQAAHGIAPTPIPGAITPSMQPRETLTQKPGELPSFSRVTRGGVGAAAAAGPSGVPRPAEDLIAREYQDAMGGGPMPTGGRLVAIQDYAARHNLPSPIQLSAQGQKDLKDVDDVMGQIALLKQKMLARGWDKDDTRGYLTDYGKYYLGNYTPNNDLYTGLSFEAIRSAAAALKSTASRAYPIISRALDHTPHFPTLTRPTADTPKNMFGKLTEMETILANGKAQILADERKTGVIPQQVQPLPGAGGGQPSNDLLNQLIKEHSGGPK